MEGKKPRRANLRLVFLGTVPPLLLMGGAWALDALWRNFRDSGVLAVFLAIGAVSVTLVVAREFYLPWLLRDRSRTGGRVLGSLWVALVPAVYVSGYRDVALALVVLGIIIMIKRRREAGPGAVDDESSWAYVGEGPDGDPDADPGDLSVDRAEAPADPYEVLGIPRRATPEEIKAAYRQVIKDCHPDSNGGAGDTARFRRAVEAYTKLMG